MDPFDHHPPTNPTQKEKKALITLNYGLLDVFCGYFWMLKVLDLLVTEIQFFMMFRYSVVYTRVFGNRRISIL